DDQRGRARHGVHAAQGEPAQLRPGRPAMTAEASAPRLVVTSPADMAGTILLLAAPELVIGHSATADLVLRDTYVSRRHALVTVDEAGQVASRDLDSTGRRDGKRAP